jgi:hypothetical protein
MLVKVVEASEILERDGEAAAIRFAARLKCLGAYRDRIQKAHAAHTNPSFYLGLGSDPEQLFNDGVAALRELIAGNV